jgi:hypothetical protein
MRTSILSAALVAALSITMWSPSRAEAQVRIFPTVSYSPYAYSYGSYGYPSYNYAYTWSNPYYSTYSSYWGTPYNYGSWNWYTPNYNSSYYGYNRWPYLGWRNSYWY